MTDLEDQSASKRRQRGIDVFRSALYRHWLPLLVGIAVLVHLVPVWNITFGYARPPLKSDAAFLEHLGWYLTKGGAMYTDAWDPKFPLSYETTAILAILVNDLFVGDNMYAFHVLSVTATVIASVTTVALVGVLSYDVTDDPIASLLAGLTLFVLPGYHFNLAYGYKPKYFALAAGLAGLYLYKRDHPLWSGIATVGSLGYWQLAIVFPLLVLGETVRSRDRSGLGAFSVGAAVMAGLVFAPVVLLGALDNMIAETVIAPLALAEGAPFALTLERLLLYFRYSIVIAVVGAVGVVLAATRAGRGTTWWIPIGALWFALGVIFLDFDNYPDLIPLVGFLGIGLAVVYAELDRAIVRYAVVAGFGAGIVFSVVMLGGFGVVYEPYATPGPAPMESLAEPAISPPAYEETPTDTPDVRYLFWNGIEPEVCHYRFSAMELEWISRTPADWEDTHCGDLSMALDQLDLPDFAPISYLNISNLFALPPNPIAVGS